MSTYDLAYLIGAILGSLFAGALVGLVPLICGLVKHRVGLAIGGFFACLVANFALGLILSIPACILFTVLIFVTKKK